jgi:hypothetical protein
MQLLVDQVISLELSLFDDNQQLIGRAYKNISVNEINWLNEIDDDLSIELLDEND